MVGVFEMGREGGIQVKRHLRLEDHLIVIRAVVAIVVERRESYQGRGDERVDRLNARLVVFQGAVQLEDLAEILHGIDAVREG